MDAPRSSCLYLPVYPFNKALTRPALRRRKHPTTRVGKPPLQNTTYGEHATKTTCLAASRTLTAGRPAHTRETHRTDTPPAHTTEQLSAVALPFPVLDK